MVLEGHLGREVSLNGGMMIAVMHSAGDALRAPMLHAKLTAASKVSLLPLAESPLPPLPDRPLPLLLWSGINR